MITQAIGFAIGVVDLLGNVGPFALACVLAPMIRSRLHALLVVVNLWLLMELTTTLVGPTYQFGELLMERLLATAIQVALAYRLITWWRARRVESESVSAR